MHAVSEPARDLRWRRPGLAAWLGLIAALMTGLATCSALEQRYLEDEEIRSRPAGGR